MEKDTLTCRYDNDNPRWKALTEPLPDVAELWTFAWRLSQATENPKIQAMLATMHEQVEALKARLAFEKEHLHQARQVIAHLIQQGGASVPEGKNDAGLSE